MVPPEKSTRENEGPERLATTQARWSRRLLVTVLLATTDPTPAPAAAPIAPPVTGRHQRRLSRGRTGDSVVVLELVVATDGTVSDAEVLEGAEPFAEQARRAVLTWQFVPAMRGTTPVAARFGPG